MYLDEGLMQCMDDKHLIASLRNAQDNLTDTSVEKELLQRMEELIEYRENWESLLEKLESDDIQQVFEIVDSYKINIDFFKREDTKEIIRELVEIMENTD